ncbi:hypothetical protein EI94DRAFT_1735675 [Lactarius quietus]|nr:hypothetical protein EI94DRAFT_1735675 [Lactarius quietus]
MNSSFSPLPNGFIMCVISTSPVWREDAPPNGSLAHIIPRRPNPAQAYRCHIVPIIPSAITALVTVL